MDYPALLVCLILDVLKDTSNFDEIMTDLMNGLSNFVVLKKIIL